MKRFLAILCVFMLTCISCRAEGVSLKSGARGDKVRLLQAKLLEYGFWNKTPDGVFDSETEAAVIDMQRYLGDEPNGIIDETLYSLITDGGFPVYERDISYGDCGSEVERLQKRLASLNYLDGGIDGVFDSKIQEAIENFQNVNGLMQNACADYATQSILYSPAATPSNDPVYRYYIKISVADQRLYVFTWANGNYSTLVKSMVCSTGLKNTPTPTGIFASGGPVARWCYFVEYDCWAQYAFRIEGSILIHSVLYEKANENTLRIGSLKNLGKRASHGCVRVTLENAKWIYDHCKAGTTVEVF